MGAETRNQRFAGDAASRQKALEGIQRRRSAIRSQSGLGPQPAPVQREALSERPTPGDVSFFPGETPQGRPIFREPGFIPGLEEASYRRDELTTQRDRPGRREALYESFRQAQEDREGQSIAPGGAVERGANIFGQSFGGAGQGLRSGIVFGPGRSNRFPEPGTPEYQQLISRLRSTGR